MLGQVHGFGGEGRAFIVFETTFSVKNSAAKNKTNAQNDDANDWTNHGKFGLLFRGLLVGHHGGKEKAHADRG